MMITENNALYNYVSIRSVGAMIHQLFRDSPDEDDVLDQSYLCMRLLGNIHIDTEMYEGRTDDEGVLELPCCALEIDYVADGRNDWISNSWYNQQSKWYPQGYMVPYEFFGTHIKLEIPKFKKAMVTVHYKTEKHDNDGYMLITQQEQEACAYYWKYIDTQRKMFQGNQVAASTLPYIKAEKNRKINQARLPEALSQNFFDQFANVVYSRDRKIYNKNYKPVKLKG